MAPPLYVKRIYIKCCLQNDQLIESHFVFAIPISQIAFSLFCMRYLKILSTISFFICLVYIHGIAFARLFCFHLSWFQKTKKQKMIALSVSVFYTCVALCHDCFRVSTFLFFFCVFCLDDLSKTSMRAFYFSSTEMDVQFLKMIQMIQLKQPQIKTQLLNFGNSENWNSKSSMSISRNHTDYKSANEGNRLGEARRGEDYTIGDDG